MGLQAYTLQEGLNIELGQGGYDYVAAGISAVTVSDDTYVAITAIIQAEVTLTSVDTDIWDTVTITIPIGMTIYGRWSSVEVAAGDRAIVYRG
jgi:hypothetical protein